MKGSLVLTVILGIVAVHGHWERSKVYKYDVKAKILTYSSQSSNEPTGLFYRLHLSLRAYSDNVIIGQITQAEFANVKSQQRYDDSNRSSFSDSDDDSDFENTPLSKPFKINLRNGVIESLGVDDSMSVFEVNQLKSIMSPFQIDTNGEQSGAAYRKIESTNGRRCEISYDISLIPEYLILSEWVPLPGLKKENEEVIEIVKTKDSANCVGRITDISAVGDHLNEENVRENYLSIVERQRIVVSGSVHNFTIQSTLTSNKLMNRNAPLITVNTNSTLESVETASQRSTQDLPVNLKIVDNLIYDFSNKMEHDRYQSSQQQEIWHDVGAEYSWTGCWTLWISADRACLWEFGRDWTFTNVSSKCGFLGLGIKYECKRIRW